MADSSAESHLEELQAEMSHFWGVHAPHPLELPDLHPGLPHPLPHPPPALFPGLHAAPFYLPPLPDLDMEARSNVRRTRVCKRCKFSTSDAREFLHHQIREHSESVEVHQCDKCEFVTAVYSELVSHKRIHRKSSTRRFSEGSETGLIDDANNNKKHDDSMEPPPFPQRTSPDLQITDSPSPIPSVGSPETPQSINAIATRNYTCNQCGFKCTSSKTNLRHMVEAHNAVFDIFECDLCDYATRYKHKLPRHRECHFNNNNQRPYPKIPTSPSTATLPTSVPVFPDHEHIERDENCNQTKVSDRVCDKYATITQRLNIPTSKTLDQKAHIHMSGGQLVSSTAPKMTSPGVMAVKHRLSSGMSGTPSQVTSKARPSCTPVREAVDPAKYVTIREPDGVKYACSKCGNIYKWRKSLNKHWKEKHDGEIPDPRPNFTPLSIPQIQAKAAANKMKHGVPSTAALMNQFPPGLLTTAGMNPMMQPTKGHKSQAYSAPTLSQVLKRPPMLGHNVPEDMSKRYFSPYQAMAERSSPEVHNAEFAERDIHRNIYGDFKPNALDLSRKPNGQHVPVKHRGSMETAIEPPQDQPLDFSKKSTRAEAPMQTINKENDFSFKKFSDFPHAPIVPEQTASLSLQCPSCAYLGRDKQDYDNHMELHLRKRHYKCAECQQVFFTIGELNSHFLDNHSEVLHSKAGMSELGAEEGSERPQLLKYLTDSSKQLLSCVVCGAIFQWQWTLAKHFVQDHPTLPNPYSKRPREGTSNAEPERKRSKGSEAAGRRSSADPLEEVIPFSGAGEITAENTAIVIPQAPEDTQKVSPASSTSSSSKGRGKGVKDYQMRDFEGLPFKCKFCEYKARWPSEITQHMKNHSDEKPYLCPRCSYRSKWKWDVVKHLKRCGGGTVKDVIDTTKIKDCHKIHVNRNVLSNGPPNVTVMAHMKLPTEAQKVDDGSAILQHDSGDSSSEHVDAATTLALMESKIPEMTGETQNGGIPGQMHYCPHCPFIGHSQAELKRHTRVHSDEKPFICKTCGYSSKWKCDLKKHLRTYNHTSAVPLIYGGHGRKPTDWSDDEKMDKTSDDEADMMQDIHQCSKCNFVTHHPALLAGHKKVHLQRKTALSAKLTCKKCSFEANDLPTFLQHKFQHNQNGEAASTGSRDSGTEEGSNQPQKHRRKASKQFRVVHSNVNNFDSSEEAGSGYDEASFLASSYGSYADSEGEPQDLSVKKYYCDWCNWSTTNLNVLYSHAKVMHSQGTRNCRTESVGSSGSEDKFKLSFAESLDLRPINMTHSSASVSSARLDDELVSSLAPVSPMTAIKKDTRRKRKLKPCPKCDYVTDNMTTLQRHLSKHGGNGKFTCQMCDYSVDRQHILDYHVKNVHNGGLPSQVLQSPSEVFQVAKTADPYAGDTEEADEEEVSISHVKGQEVKSIRRGSKVTYGCIKCPFESINITNTYNHSRQHGLAKRYRCPACDYSQDHSRHVLNHIKTIHAMESGLIDANPSSKAPRSPLQKPMKFVCRRCPFTTLNHTRYLIHRKVHNVKKFSCNTCAHKSTTAQLLAQHKAKSHA